jgi:antitoxin component of MazEF toxin-antitoxin module
VQVKLSKIDIMRVILEKWGSGAAVRIPVSVMAAAHIGLSQAVDVREEQGCIVSESSLTRRLARKFGNPLLRSCLQ